MSMQQPTLDMAANLRWTKSGVVWADYLLTGLAYGYRPDIDKQTVRRLHTMLTRALPGESLILGLAAPDTPEAVVRRMVEGVDLQQHQDWAEECLHTLDTLEDLLPGRRVFWLSIPLAGGNSLGQVRSGGRAAWSSLAEFLGLPRPRLSTEEIVRRVQQADRIVADIPALFGAQPASAAQMVWLWRHSIERGLRMDADLPAPDTSVRGSGAAALAAVRVDEGAQSDRAPRGWRSVVPKISRAVKIDQPYDLSDPPASYQVFLALAETPVGGVYFPGSELFTLVDDISGLDVDYALRLRVTAGAEVAKKNQKALRNINEQYEQREGAVSTGASMLDQAAAALAEYTDLLESDSSEVEVAWTALFALGSGTEKQALADARALAKVFEAQSYKLVAPLGFQEDLFWAFVPGVPTPRIVEEFTQITTSRHFAAYVPCIRNSLGDRTGPLFALNISSARTEVVHLDIAGRSLRDVSGSVSVTGELGGGKSKTIKFIMDGFIDRGGQAVIVDQSDSGEYAAWASAVTSAVVADLVDPEYSVDPLRLFGPRIGGEITESVMLVLLRLQPNSPQGLALATVLEPSYRAAHPYEGLGDLVEHLLDQNECAVPHAGELGGAMKLYARKSYAAALFARDLPLLPLTAPAIVFRTNKVQLPTTAQIESRHQFEHMPLERRFGSVVYNLITRIARAVCFQDPRQASMFVCDEVDHVVRSGDVLDVLIDFVLRGRKESAYVVIGDQDCQFGDERLRGLIKVRVAHRHTDEVLARRALEWLGMDPGNAMLLKEYMEDTSPVTGEDNYVDPIRRGEGYLRDGNGNVGRIKVLQPSRESRRDAARTTPRAVTG